MFQRITKLFRSKTEPKVIGMTDSEKLIIKRFANGEHSLMKVAIQIHRRYIPILGVRGTPEQDFMAEVDHPQPDYRLREFYRIQLVEENDECR